MPSTSTPTATQPDQNQNQIIPWAFIDCPTDILIILLSHMLNLLIAHNDQVVLTPDALTRFHSRAAPGISVVEYLKRIVKYTNLEKIPLLSLLHYIDITCLNLPTFTLSSLTVHRFLIAGVCAGSKAQCDVFCTNSHYAKVGGIKVQELNALERELVKVTGWALCCHADQLQRYYTSLIRSHGGYTQAPPPETPPFRAFPRSLSKPRSSTEDVESGAAGSGSAAEAEATEDGEEGDGDGDQDEDMENEDDRGRGSPKYEDAVEGQEEGGTPSPSEADLIGREGDGEGRMVVDPTSSPPSPTLSNSATRGRRRSIQYRNPHSHFHHHPTITTTRTTGGVESMEVELETSSSTAGPSYTHSHSNSHTHTQSSPTSSTSPRSIASSRSRGSKRGRGMSFSIPIPVSSPRVAEAKIDTTPVMGTPSSGSVSSALGLGSRTQADGLVGGGGAVSAGTNGYHSKQSEYGDESGTGTSNGSFPAGSSSSTATASATTRTQSSDPYPSSSLYSSSTASQSQPSHSPFTETQTTAQTTAPTSAPPPAPAYHHHHHHHHAHGGGKLLKSLVGGIFRRRSIPEIEAVKPVPQSSTGVGMGSSNLVNPDSNGGSNDGSYHSSRPVEQARPTSGRRKGDSTLSPMMTSSERARNPGSPGLAKPVTPKVRTRDEANSEVGLELELN